MNLKPDYHGIEIILLDFGGVLFDITSTEAWLTDYINPLLGRPLDMEAFREQYHAHECGTLSSDELKAQLEEFAGKRFETTAFERAWNGILVDMPEKSLRIVHDLASRYELYLLSNTNEIHYREWKRRIDERHGWANFRSAFKEAFYSHELGCIKPDPAIYRKVHEAIGSPDKRSCLFFDDKKLNADAAAEFGWRAAHVDLSKTDLTALVGKMGLLEA